MVSGNCNNREIFLICQQAMVIWSLKLAKHTVERETGLEPATACLEGRNSTTELLPLKPHPFYR
jgi:hypothetical protein